MRDKKARPASQVFKNGKNASGGLKDAPKITPGQYADAQKSRDISDNAAAKAMKAYGGTGGVRLGGMTYGQIKPY
jgi:hypothetical protein